MNIIYSMYSSFIFILIETLLNQIKEKRRWLWDTQWKLTLYL